jgi:hypothetical protein
MLVLMRRGAELGHFLPFLSLRHCLSSLNWSDRPENVSMRSSFVFDSNGRCLLLPNSFAHGLRSQRRGAEGQPAAAWPVCCLSLDVLGESEGGKRTRNE